jgi:hypothetical protein
VAPDTPAGPASRRDVLCVQLIERCRRVMFYSIGIGSVVGCMQHSVAGGRGRKRDALFEPPCRFPAKTRIQ